MSRESLAWAAGFFDGEGSTLLSKRHQLTISVAQSGDEGRLILERFNQSVGGIGKVKGPYTTKGPTHKPVYVFGVYGFEKVQAIIAMLWPWLTEPKRRQASGRLSAFVARVRAGTRDGTLCCNGHKLDDLSPRGRCRHCHRDETRRAVDRNRQVPWRPRPSRRKGPVSNDA